MSEYVMLKCEYCGNFDRPSFLVRKDGYVCKLCGRFYREKTSEEEIRCNIGFEELKNYNFSFAERTFQDIAIDFPHSVDARWGLLLARYGIVFIKGFYMGEIEPIYCFPNYSYAYGSFTDEAEYREIEAILADDSERLDIYRKHAEHIERAFKIFSGNVSKNENDVFICVKISRTTASNPYEKGNTADYEKACDIYTRLKEQGKNVFFSYVTLKNSIDSDMEIWRNMLKSRKMLLIGSRAEYFNSVWVRSEWERWLMLDKAVGGNERKKNLYIYVLGSERENLYAKLPAGLKALHPQIYTESNEADLINDICYCEEEPYYANIRGYGINTAKTNTSKADKAENKIVKTRMTASAPKKRDTVQNTKKRRAVDKNTPQNVSFDTSLERSLRSAARKIWGIILIISLACILYGAIGVYGGIEKDLFKGSEDIISVGNLLGGGFILLPVSLFLLLFAKKRVGVTWPLISCGLSSMAILAFLIYAVYRFSAYGEYVINHWSLSQALLSYCLTGLLAGVVMASVFESFQPYEKVDNSLRISLLILACFFECIMASLALTDDINVLLTPVSTVAITVIDIAIIIIRSKKK